jgi:hypothetical protein
MEESVEVEHELEDILGVVQHFSCQVEDEGGDDLGKHFDDESGLESIRDILTDDGKSFLGILQGSLFLLSEVKRNEVSELFIVQTDSGLFQVGSEGEDVKSRHDVLNDP